jgi:hypothetical protein
VVFVGAGFGGLTAAKRDSVKLAGVLRSFEERWPRFERPIQSRFEDRWLVGKQFAKIFIHDHGTYVNGELRPFRVLGGSKA